VFSGNYDEISNYNFIDRITQEKIRIHLLNYDDIIGKVKILKPGKERTIELFGVNYLDISEFVESEVKLYDSPQIFYSDDNVYYVIPVKEGGRVISNIEYEINIYKFLVESSSGYYFGKKMWTWYLDKNDEIVCLSYSEGEKSSEKLIIDDIDLIKEKSKNGLMDISEDNISFGKKIKAITVASPLRLGDLNITLGFSLDKEDIFSNLNQKIQMLFFSLLFIFSIIIAAFIDFLYRTLESERKLVESNENLSLVMNSMPVGIILRKPNGTVRDTNEFALNIFGFKDKNEIIGRNIIDYISHENKSERTSSKKRNGINYNFVNENGDSVSIVVNKINMKYFDENLIMDIFVDVSHIEKLREIAEEANKSKSQFIANISHEIRTPMNGIIVSGEILNKTDLSYEQKDLLKIIMDSSRNLLTIINDILDVSKIEFGKIELENIEFSLKDLVEGIYDQFTINIIEKDILLLSDVKSHIPEKLIGDPNRIGQIIINFLSNAIKFTEKGKILLSYDIDEFHENGIVLHIFVADSGIGIADNQLENIFDSFVQEDQSVTRKYGGTGLGTTISKNLVELMGGKIWAESPNNIFKAESKGSVFHCTLNLGYVKETRKKTLKSNYDVKVLVMDYDKQSSEITRSVFNSFGVEPKIMNSYEDGFNILRIPFDNMNFNKVLINGVGREDDILKRIKDLKESNENIPESIIVLVSNMDLELMKYYRNEGVKLIFMPITHRKILEILNEKEIDNKEEALEKSNRKLLVVEDNEINIKVFLKIFENLEMNISIARNGSEAIEKLKKEQYDIIFMDIQMPVMNGIDASKEIRKIGIETPIIAMSAYNEKDGLLERQGFEIQDFVEKPIKISEIEKILNKYL